MAPKKWAELTPEEKRKRLDYARRRRQLLTAKLRELGIVGAPRTKMSEEERKQKRYEYAKSYNKRIREQAKLYRQLMEKGM